MSVEVELGHWNCNKCDLQIGTSGDTIRDTTIWYDVGDRVLHAQTRMGEPIGEWTVGTITRLNAKEFTFATVDGTYVTTASRGCGCGGG